MLRFYKILQHGVIEKPNQRIVISGHVQQPARLFMQTELRPAQYLEEFLHSADTAGHGDEAVRQLGHQSLALVHGADHAQFRKPAMRNFLAHQGAWDDAGDITLERKNCVRNNVHQTDVAATVYQPVAAPDKLAAEYTRRLGVNRLGSMARPHKHANISPASCHL